MINEKRKAFDPSADDLPIKLQRKPRGYRYLERIVDIIRRGGGRLERAEIRVGFYRVYGEVVRDGTLGNHLQFGKKKNVLNQVSPRGEWYVVGDNGGGGKIHD